MFCLARELGIEPRTISLTASRSTAELLPNSKFYFWYFTRASRNNQYWPKMVYKKRTRFENRVEVSPSSCSNLVCTVRQTRWSPFLALHFVRSARLTRLRFPAELPKIIRYAAFCPWVIGLQPCTAMRYNTSSAIRLWNNACQALCCKREILMIFPSKRGSIPHCLHRDLGTRWCLSFRVSFPSVPWMKSTTKMVCS